MQTEQEMRDSEAPTFDTEQELMAYITELAERQHDYGTCVYAMSLAATATFNFMARKLGVSGFQASCADLDVVRRTRRIDGPFTLLTGDKLLYPQYDLEGDLRNSIEEWEPWAKEQAQKLIDEHGGEPTKHRYQDDDGEWHEYQAPHPNVWAHWKRLVANPRVPGRRLM